MVAFKLLSLFALIVALMVGAKFATNQEPNNQRVIYDGLMFAIGWFAATAFHFWVNPTPIEP